MCRYSSRLKSSRNVRASPQRVIALTLFGSNSRHSYGAVRHLQLRRVYFPTWSVRVYIPPVTSSLAVPPLITNKLRSLGAEVVEAPPSLADFHPKLWHYDVIRDENVTYVMLLDADQRMDEHLEAATNLWLSNKLNQTNSSLSNTQDILCVIRKASLQPSNEHENKNAENSDKIQFLAAKRAYLQALLASVSSREDHADADTASKFVEYLQNSSSEAERDDQRLVDVLSSDQQEKLLNSVMLTLLRSSHSCYEYLTDQSQPGQFRPEPPREFALSSALRGEKFDEFQSPDS